MRWAFRRRLRTTRQDRNRGVSGRGGDLGLGAEQTALVWVGSLPSNTAPMVSPRLAKMSYSVKASRVVGAHARIAAAAASLRHRLREGEGQGISHRRGSAARARFIASFPSILICPLEVQCVLRAR